VIKILKRTDAEKNYKLADIILEEPVVFYENQVDEYFYN
jgi:hypothetical protein